MTIDVNAEAIEVLGHTLHRIKDDLDPFGDRRNPCWHVELEHMDISLTLLVPNHVSVVGEDLWQLATSRDVYGGLSGFGDTPEAAAQNLLEEIVKLSAWAQDRQWGQRNESHMERKIREARETGGPVPLPDLRQGKRKLGGKR